MNNQFATQYLREEFLPEQRKAVKEDGGMAAPAGGSTTGGGVTNGGAWSGVNGEQTTVAFKKKKKSIEENAPQLAGEKSKTNKQGAKNLSAYSSVGFTKAPSALEAGKKIKGVQVKDLWDEEPLSESRAYNQFKKEAATRNKPDQLHQAAKVIQNKLEEVSRLLEFTAQMRNELTEGDENLEYKQHTKKVFEKINSKVIEVYTKVKSLK